MLRRVLHCGRDLCTSFKFSYHVPSKKETECWQMDPFLRKQLLLLFVSFPLILSVHGQGPELVIVPNQLSVQYGSSIVMSCVAADGGGSQPTISWSLNGRVIESGSNTNFTISSRIISEAGLTFVQSTLHVCSVDFSKIGQYSCSAANSGGSVSEAWNIEITGAQATDLVLVPLNQTIIYSESVIMVCVAYDIPLPNITFTHNGTLVDNTTSSRIIVHNEVFTERGVNFASSTLQICSLDLTNVGEYSCIATNGLGNPDTQSWNLQLITNPSPPEIIIASSSRTVDYGSSVTMSCTSTGFPLPIVTFSLNGVQVRNSSTICVTENIAIANRSVTVESIVTINTVGANNIGLYSCNALNDQGDHSRYWNLSLTVTLEPEIAIRPASEISMDYQATVIMSCVTYGIPLPIISYSKNGVAVSVSEPRITVYSRTISEEGIDFVQSNLVICGLTAVDIGMYECEATNPFGASSFTWQMDVTIPATPEDSTSTMEGPTRATTDSESDVSTTDDPLVQNEMTPVSTTNVSSLPNTENRATTDTSVSTASSGVSTTDDSLVQGGSNSKQQSQTVYVIGGVLGVFVVLSLLLVPALSIVLCLKWKRNRIFKEKPKKPSGTHAASLPLPEPPIIENPHAMEDDHEVFEPLELYDIPGNIYDNDEQDIAVTTFTSMNTSVPEDHSMMVQNQAYMSVTSSDTKTVFQSQESCKKTRNKKSLKANKNSKTVLAQTLPSNVNARPKESATSYSTLIKDSPVPVDDGIYNNDTEMGNAKSNSIPTAPEQPYVIMNLRD